MQGAKHEVLEGGTRMFFAFQGPGVQAGVIDSTLADVIDILPTLADLAGELLVVCVSPQLQPMMPEGLRSKCSPAEPQPCRDTGHCSQSLTAFMCTRDVTPVSAVMTNWSLALCFTAVRTVV